MAEPRWLAEARKHIGTKEIPGPKHSPVIMGWVARLANKHKAHRWIASYVTSDEIPWCGLFVGGVMDACGFVPPVKFLAAKGWLEWGQPLKLSRVGAILVFGRKGGGHVGFYVGEDKHYYHVLGGNQSNSVNITKIARSRLIGMRWPPNEPVVGGKAVASSNNLSVSSNEA